MSFDWANALLFRLSGSGLAANSRGGETHSHTRQSGTGNDPNYERLLMLAKSFNPDWRTITLNVARDASEPVSATIDTGTGGQPQKRTQYLLNRETGVVVKTSTFSSGNLGQRLRAIVRFGHTGEYYGSAGQGIAAFASLSACVLVYTGLSLSIRRLTAKLKRKEATVSANKDVDTNEVAESTIELDQSPENRRAELWEPN
jgi:uncharacterized iron-regulated membrane protein